MLFNSYIFIFIFFPLCLAGFYLLVNVDNSLWAKLWLIGFSLWFYGYFNLSYLAIMVISILLNYALIMWITRKSLSDIHKRAVMILGVVCNLGILFYFKYYDFFIENINAVFKTAIPLKGILLPLGISFFTFQQIGLLVDVYRGDVEELSFVDHALFVSFFPQLIAGPIVSQEEMLPQFRRIHGRKFDSETFGRSLSLFIMGMAKKVLIADVLGRAVDAGYASLSAMNGLDSFLIMIWYSLQLYFDFSGYCDMARGLAGMLGFELPINFDSPYKAGNIVEFWKMWHRTLTRFFTRYVYIPLGGNRRGEARMLVNILIVYFLSGLWHGAGWNYILWGMMHGVLYVITRVIIRHKPENGLKFQVKPVKVLLTFLYVSFAWVYFRAADIAQGTALVKNIFTNTWKGISYPLTEAMKMDELWYVVKLLHLDRKPIGQCIPTMVITTVALGLTFASPNAAVISGKLKPRPVIAVLLALLGVWCVVSLSEVSTFLYFNF